MRIGNRLRNGKRQAFRFRKQTDDCKWTLSTQDDSNGDGARMYSDSRCDNESTSSIRLARLKCATVCTVVAIATLVAGSRRLALAESVTSRQQIVVASPVSLRDDQSRVVPRPPADVIGPDAHLYHSGNSSYDDSWTYDQGWDESNVPMDFRTNYSPWVFTADALFFRPEGERQLSLSADSRLDEFDYRLGARLSLSRRFDTLDGWEFAYVGPYDWVTESRTAGVGLNSDLVGTGINLSTFNGAVFHEQAYNSRLQSVEFNSKYWGWDVITTSFGVRYINVTENFVFNSSTALGAQGRYAVATSNDLMGGQIGLDLKFPTGRLTTTSHLKGAIFANTGEGDSFLSNDGVVQFNNSSGELDFASLIEFGYYVNYQLTPRLSVRGGYETWWIYGLALAPSQAGNSIGRNTGGKLDINDDTFYHGGTLGVEYSW